MHAPKEKFAIFASGRGSNAEALMNAFATNSIPADLELIISNRTDAPVLQRANTRGYRSLAVPHAGLSRKDHEKALLQVIQQHHITHILLAGYMRVLTPYFLKAFKELTGGHILNIHPSLLPDFPGLHAVKRQHNAGVRISGATVHCVTESVDAGPIILQGSLEFNGTETLEEMEHRIREEVEHSLYPRALCLFLSRIANPNYQEIVP